jgi:hypothetical protein
MTIPRVAGILGAPPSLSMGNQGRARQNTLPGLQVVRVGQLAADLALAEDVPAIRVTALY